MTLPRILLAHRNPIVLVNLADELRRRRVRAEVLTARTEALLIQTQCFRPANAVLLDMGFSRSQRLLECLAADPARPGVCLCADKSAEQALDKAALPARCRFAAAGAPVGVICDQLQGLLDGGAAHPTPPAARRESARRLLFLAGVSPCTKGGRYLRLALEMIGEDEALLVNLNGRLLPAMALRCGESPVNIERCMRYAVDQLWRRMPPDDRLRLFPHGGGQIGVRQALYALSARLKDGITLL